MNPRKAAFVAVVCIVLLIGASNITQSYDYNVAALRDAPGSSGTVTSFTSQDLSAASWLKSNLPPTTLIISDPVTTLILAGLAGLPYTVDGITYAGTTAISNVTLFKNAVANLTAKSLADLVQSYRASDKYYGFDSSKLRVVLVVNNRTSWWVNGVKYYYYAYTFMNFPGFAAYSNTSFVSSAFNASTTYRIYSVTIPQGLLTTGTP